MPIKRLTLLADWLPHHWLKSTSRASSSGDPAANIYLPSVFLSDRNLRIWSTVADWSAMETLRRWLRRTIGPATKRKSSASDARVPGQDTSASTSPERTSGMPCTTTSSTSATDADPLPVYKVVTVGGGGVGKSSLIVQFMYDEVQSLKQHIW